MKIEQIKGYFINKIEKLKKLDSAEFVINTILLFIIVMGIRTSIYMLTVNRSLWVDEAAFAYSFSQRNLLNLTVGAFEWDQIAPIIYLYIVKIITILLGNSEITLRLFSVISYVLTLILTYKFAKNVFKLKYPLMPAAFVANIPIVLRYSNQFITYMFDAVVCLFVLYMYYLYTQKKIDFKKLIIIFVIAIWASNPACFCIGGVLLCELVVAISEKNYKYIKNIFIGIGCVLLSFGIYYFYWLRDVSVSSNMQEFWGMYAFPIYPNSLEEISRLFFLLDNVMWRTFGFASVIIGIGTIVALVIGAIKQDKMKISILFMIFIMLFASSISMFPFDTRLLIFIYPILALLIFDLLQSFFTKDKLKNLIVVVLGFILIFSNVGIIYYSIEENVYLENEEANFLVDYLYDNIKEDEKIYVYNTALPVFQYKVGYGATTFGKYGNEVKYGRGNWLKEVSGIEPEDIVNEEKMYILTYHYKDCTDKDIEYLMEKGYIELVINPYMTSLFYYVRDINNLKSKVSYEIEKTEVVNGKYIVTLGIENTGETILNYGFDKIVVSSRENTSIEENIKEEFEQGEIIHIPIQIDFLNTDKVELQLCNKGHYWFDELGINPVEVRKDMFKE